MANAEESCIVTKNIIDTGESRCKICNQETMSLWINNLDGLSIWRCKTCDSALTFPIPEVTALEDHYSSTYYKENENIAVIERRRDESSAVFASLLDNLEALQGGRRVLDVGCSYGFFLDQARARGWDVKGLELGRPAAKFGRNQLGLDVFNGQLAELAQQSPEFDVITFWHVLEHVPDPHFNLTLAFEMLPVGGWIAIRVPNISSLSRLLLGKGWHWFLPHDHIHHLSPAGLATLVNRAGFETKYLTTQQGDYPYDLPACAGLSLIQAAGLAKIAKKSLKTETVIDEDLPQAAGEGYRLASTFLSICNRLN